MEGNMTSTTKIIPFKRDDKPSSGKKLLKGFGMAIVAFAIVGLVFSSLMAGFGGPGGREELTFGRYGDRKISYRYDNSFGRAVASGMAEYDDNLNDNQEFMAFIRRVVWQREFSNSVVRAAMAYYLEKSGYVPSSRVIDRQMSKLAAFQTNGAFDSSKYNDASQRIKTSLRESLREFQTYETWYNDTIDSLRRSEAEINFLQDMQATIRTYDYITLPFSEYPDNNVMEYAQENSQLFQTRKMSRITVEEESTALEVAGLFDERRQNVGAFAALVQEYSTDSYKDDEGSMGATAYHVLQETLPTEDVDTVFALAAGEIAGPFETDFGWIILHADDDTAPPAPETLIEETRDYMLQHEVGIIEDSMLDRARQLREKAISAESFQAAMEAEDLEVSTTAPFPFNYGGDSLLGDTPDKTDDSALVGTTSSVEFWNGIAKLENVGDFSQPIVLSGSVGIFALASIETKEPQENWDMIVDNEFGSAIQQEFQSIILDEDSKLLTDNFSQTYDSVFGQP